jgi:gamma-glutamylcyclotransferase (GGCT)/AIG2-like uncharacterized protein YtfP
MMGFKMNLENRTQLLFSYGTLQYRNIQIAHFGRELAGHADTLPGYRRGKVPINDPEVVASSGETHYENLLPGSSPEDEVHGMVYEITGQELAAADKYEADADYERILVTLRSGTQAWVYLCASP